MSPAGIASATVSWSRSRESSLSIDAHSSPRRSRICGIGGADTGIEMLRLGQLGGRKLRQQAAVEHRAVGDALEVASHGGHGRAPYRVRDKSGWITACSTTIHEQTVDDGRSWHPGRLPFRLGRGGV